MPRARPGQEGGVRHEKPEDEGGPCRVRSVSGGAVSYTHLSIRNIWRITMDMPRGCLNILRSWPVNTGLKNDGISASFPDAGSDR